MNMNMYIPVPIRRHVLRRSSVGAFIPNNLQAEASDHTGGGALKEARSTLGACGSRRVAHRQALIVSRRVLASAHEERCTCGHVDLPISRSYILILIEISMPMTYLL